MKFNPDTISQPVTGAEARRLNAALKSGKSLANAAARATAERIAQRIREREQAAADRAPQA